MDRKNEPQPLADYMSMVLLQPQASAPQDLLKDLRWSLSWELIGPEGKSLQCSPWLPETSKPGLIASLKDLPGPVQCIRVHGRNPNGVALVLCQVEYSLIKSFSYLAAGVAGKGAPVPVGITVELKNGRMIHVLRNGSAFIQEKK